MVRPAVYCKAVISKTLLLMVILLAGPPPSLKAQNHYIDSLKNELNRQKEDTARFELLIEIGSQLYQSANKRAVYYFTRLKNSAQKKGSAYYESRAYSGLGDIYYSKSDYDSSLMYYLKADSILSTLSTTRARQSSANNKASMANIEQVRGNYNAAIQYRLSAIGHMKSSDAKNKWQAIGNLYEGVGSIYHDMEQYQKALQYDLQALEAHKKHPNNQQLTGLIELYVASDYIDLKKMDLAKSHIKYAGAIAKEINSAAYNYQLYVEWGRFYQKTLALDQAIIHFKKALAYAESLGHPFKIMNVNRMLGFSYRDQRDYPKSVAALKKALSLTKAIENKRLEAETLKKLAEVEASQQHYFAASRYYKQHLLLSDSLNEAQTKRQINEIENKYQAQQKSDSIIQLRQKGQLQLLAINKKKNQTVFVTTGALLLLLTGFIVYRSLQNKHRLLKKTDQLRTQQIIQMEKERQLVATQSLMKGQETERSRLARDLHDGVGGLLSGVKLSLSNMKGNVFLSEENAIAVNKIIGQLDNSIGELRRVSHNMMPEALIRYGLTEALENYCESIEQAGSLAVRLQTYGMETRMPQDAEIILYRITQELLTNIIKHAGADHALVQLIRQANKFTLTVEDDGKGFENDSQAINNGAGLENIKARAGYLNGTVDIRTRPGEGTSVTIEGIVT